MTERHFQKVVEQACRRPIPRPRQPSEEPAGDDQAIAENRAGARSEPAEHVDAERLLQTLSPKIRLLQDTIALMNEMRKGNAAGRRRQMSKAENLEAGLHTPCNRRYLTITLLALLAGPAAGQADARSCRRVVVQEPVAKAVARSRGRRSDSTREEQVERTTRTLRVGANGEVLLGEHLGRHPRDAQQRQRRDGRDRQNRPRPRRQRRARAAAAGAGRDHRARRPRRSQGALPATARRCGATTAATSTCRSPTTSPPRRAPAFDRRRSPAVDHDQATSRGSLAPNTVSGDVRIDRRRADCAAKSISGNVEITDTQIDGGFSVRASAATCCCAGSPRGARRRARSAATSSSTTSSASRSKRNRSAATSVQRARSQWRRYELNSLSGERPAALGGKTGFEIEANSFSGAVRSDLSFTSTRTQTRSRGRRRTSAASTATAARSWTSRRFAAASSSRSASHLD